MIGVLAKVTGGILILAFMVAGALMLIKEAPSSELVNSNLLAKVYLTTNKDNYARCYNSVNGGQLLLSRVGLGYMSWPRDDVLMNKLDEAEAEFMADVHQKCDQPIKDYEKNFEAYKATNAEIAQASRTLLDRLIGYEPTPENDTSYQPSMVRTFGTDPFTDFIFTEEDVKQFFVQRIGY